MLFIQDSDQLCILLQTVRMPAAVSNRVSPPEQAGSNRLVMAAGNSEAGDTCRTFIFHQVGTAVR